MYVVYLCVLGGCFRCRKLGPVIGLDVNESACKCLAHVS